jgi:ribosome-binding ATPase YchF (GTP1/OBG family)
MADEEEDDIDEEEEEEEEVEDEDVDADGEDDDEGVGDEIDPVKKAELVEEDLQILLDIFRYIDQSSRRITERLDLEAEIELTNRQANREAQIIGRRRNGSQQQPAADGNPISWNQYENLNDMERAELLERALTALATDDNAPPPSQNRQVYYSYNK